MNEKDKSGMLLMLERYVKEEPVRFHMPGHKGRGLPFFPDMAAYDITELEGTDNLLHPDGVILEAQENAAAVFGAKKAFFLVNGATVGILAMLLALPRGSKIIVPRDAHRSVLSGCALGGHEAVFIWPEYENGAYGVVSAEAIEQAISRHAASAVIVTRPNYLGLCADGEKIAAVCAKYGALLLVDEAHGAHFAFSPLLPAGASAFADLWVQSAHKTLNALNQAAFLHVGRSEKKGMPSVDDLSRTLTLLQTTSPSYPILASLDYAVRSANEHSWTYQVARCDAVRRAMGGGLCDNNRERIGSAAISDVDRTRLVIDTAARGITGYEAYKALQTQGIVLEMADERTIVAITSPSDPDEWYTRLREGLRHIPFGRRLFGPAPRFEDTPERALPLCEAAFAQTKLVPLDKAAGYVCAVPLGLYPPGSAIVAPGEVISAQAVSFLREQELLGATLFGAAAGNVPCVK